MTPSDIRKLISLVEHGKNRDLATYAKSCERFDETARQIESIQIDKRQNAVVSEGHFKALALWQRWAETELRKKLVQQQTEALEKERLRQVAFKSSAKVQALEMLLKTALKEQLSTSRRRAEQNGVSPDA